MQDEFDHVCAEVGCPFVGQKTDAGCSCHVPREEVMRAEITRLRAALDQPAQPALSNEHALNSCLSLLGQMSAKEWLQAHRALKTPGFERLTDAEAEQWFNSVLSNGWAALALAIAEPAPQLVIPDAEIKKLLFKWVVGTRWNLPPAWVDEMRADLDRLIASRVPATEGGR